MSTSLTRFTESYFEGLGVKLHLCIYAHASTDLCHIIIAMQIFYLVLNIYLLGSCKNQPIYIPGCGLKTGYNL